MTLNKNISVSMQFECARGCVSEVYKTPQTLDVSTTPCSKHLPTFTMRKKIFYYVTLKHLSYNLNFFFLITSLGRTVSRHLLYEFVVCIWIYIHSHSNNII